MDSALRVIPKPEAQSVIQSRTEKQADGITHSGGACPRSVPHTRSKQREEATENEKDRIDVDMSWMSLARALFLSFSFFLCALSLRSFSALLRTPHPPLCARVLKGCKDRVPYFVGGDAFSFV